MTFRVQKIIFVLMFIATTFSFNSIGICSELAETKKYLEATNAIRENDLEKAKQLLEEILIHSNDKELLLKSDEKLELTLNKMKQSSTPKSVSNDYVLESKMVEFFSAKVDEKLNEFSTKIDQKLREYSSVNVDKKLSELAYNVDEKLRELPTDIANIEKKINEYTANKLDKRMFELALHHEEKMVRQKLEILKKYFIEQIETINLRINTIENKIKGLK